MFKPYYGECTGAWNHEGCHERGWIKTRSRKLCQKCEAKRKPPKPIKAMSEKRRDQIKESNKYYKWAIGRNIIQHKGKCVCEECDAEIKRPVGRNVAHIVSAGNNGSLYLEPTNHNILCFDCVIREESGTDRKKMKLYEQREKIRIELNNKYYGTNY